MIPAQKLLQLFIHDCICQIGSFYAARILPACFSYRHRTTTVLLL